MKTIKAKLEFLTPVHVGSGETIEPHEYFIKDGYLHKLNMNRFLAELSQDKKEEFVDFIDRVELTKLRTFPKDNATDLSIDGKIKVSQSVQREYNNKVKEIKNRLEINLFPVNGISKTPYLPGSSLKGAFRTAIIDCFTQKLPQNRIRITENVNWFEANLLEYDKDIRRDPFRILKIPDIPLEIGETEIIECYNYKFNKKESNAFDQRMEVTTSRFSNIGKSKVYEFEFLFNENLLEKTISIKRDRKIVEKEDLFKKTFTLEELGSYANHHYFQVLRWEMKKFFSEDKKSPELEGLRNLQVDSNQFLIRIGRFGHVESKTVDKYRNPRSNKGWGKTRTLAENKYPLGWAMVTIGEYQFKPVPTDLPVPSGLGNKTDGKSFSKKPIYDKGNQKKNSSQDQSSSTYNPFKKLKKK
ncbi:MAG: type III-A CRISPR-associated RAMP protein Csm5 [Leptospiraceae bacterium]|nr:type III-A CRISPR-associated RAMP protein Csm5 [Leptospiraceae bacterium]